VAAVFRGIDTAPQRPPLWLVIARWIGAWLGRILHALAGHQAANVIVRTAVVAAVLAIALRIFLPGFALPERAARSARGAARDDWWGLAARLASEGSFTDAAHALYLALVTAAAARGLVVIHESKTTGDYLREVRRAQGRAAPGTPRYVSASELAAWRDFTRAYEAAIYGVRVVSESEYRTLRTLASAALGDGASTGRGERALAGARS
jgi:hypothetical protein